MQQRLIGRLKYLLIATYCLTGMLMSAIGLGTCFVDTLIGSSQISAVFEWLVYIFWVLLFSDTVCCVSLRHFSWLVSPALFFCFYGIDSIFSPEKTPRGFYLYCEFAFYAVFGLVNVFIFVKALKEVTKYADASVGVLEDIAEEISEDSLRLKLFLMHREYEQCYKDWTLDTKSQMVLTEHFPHRFDIVDACLTNCDLIWLNKNFYL